MDDLWQRLFPPDLYVVQEETPVLFFLSFFVDLPKESSDLEELDAVALCTCRPDKGVETAYKAVMKPKEGTILTVARGAADKALELA